ncbi:MAG: efflux RND transporter periplasmic adaptor subunit [Pseudomonadota bacterium]
MRSTTLTAVVIAVLIVVWLLSGQLNRPEDTPLTSLADQREAQAAKIEDLAPTRVRARLSQAVEKTREIRVRGRTENKRTVAVAAEITGRVVERPVERGDVVEAGDLLCRISVDDRQAALDEARAGVKEAKQQYESNVELQTKGFINELAVAQAEARLSSAQATLIRSELNLERTRIRAPFAGVVETVGMEVGDYAAPGSSCATVVDLTPMLLVGQVPEREVMQLATGQTAAGAIATGRRVEGPITFIGAQADPATRTYTVEVEIANDDNALRSGVTTDILIPVETVKAHRVSPALFALDDEGSIGMRTVNDNNRVVFHRVNVLSSEPDGAWVTGLPDVATIITVGQELVVPGERVEISFEAQGAMPAKAADAEQDGAAEDVPQTLAEPPSTQNASQGAPEQQATLAELASA